MAIGENDTSGAVRPQPFLKWTGGKRLLAPAIVQAMPKTFDRYFEPFLGSGAVFFKLRPERATLADVNVDLINLFSVVRDSVEELIAALAPLAIEKKRYYCLRAASPEDPVSKAVRLLYLNKASFNGIYRVNRKGEFNVPFGCKPNTVLCEREKLRTSSQQLEGTNLLASDFADVIQEARDGDLVYADPPYTTKHDRNGFRRYNESLFSWDDQVRLSKALRSASARGVYVLVSNAYHDEVRSLYPDFEASTLTRTSCISGTSRGRGSVTEYLLKSPRVVEERDLNRTEASERTIDREQI